MNYGRSAAFRNWAIRPTAAPQTAPSPQIAELDVVDEATSTWHRVQLPLPCPQNVSELWQEVMRLVDPTGVTTPDTHHLVVADAAMRVVGPFTSVEQVGLGYLLKLFRLQKPPPPRSDVAANVATPARKQLLNNASKPLPQFEPGRDYGPTSYSSRHDDHPPPRSPRHGPSGPQLRRAAEWIKRWYAAEEKGQEEHAKDERPLLPDPVRESPANTTKETEVSAEETTPREPLRSDHVDAINKMVDVIQKIFPTLLDPAEPRASIASSRLQSAVQSEHGELHDEVINGLFNRKFHTFVAERTNLLLITYTESEIVGHMSTFNNLRFPSYLCTDELRVSASARSVSLAADRKQAARYDRFLVATVNRYWLDTSPTSIWKMLSGVQQRRVARAFSLHLARRRRANKTNQKHLLAFPFVRVAREALN